jgi:hypothetical protein
MRAARGKPVAKENGAASSQNRGFIATAIAGLKNGQPGEFTEGVQPQVAGFRFQVSG